MGKKKRDEYLQNHVFCAVHQTFIFFPMRIIEYLPERPYSIDGIKAILRKNSDDILFFTPNAEKEIEKRLTMYDYETFVDVGANIGKFSLRIANDYKHKSVDVIAIEAHPETYRALSKNIECNSLKNIEAVNTAITDHQGVVTLYENRVGDRINVANHFHHRDSSIRNVFDEKDSTQVKSDTLDNILSGRKVHVMKIDVEGAEVLALNGATNTLKHVRLIIVEIHGDNYENVKQILERHAFNLEVIGNTKPSTDIRCSIGHIIGSK